MKQTSADGLDNQDQEANEQAMGLAEDGKAMEAEVLGGQGLVRREKASDGGLAGIGGSMKEHYNQLISETDLLEGGHGNEGPQLVNKDANTGRVGANGP